MSIFYLHIQFEPAIVVVNGVKRFYKTSVNFSNRKKPPKSIDFIALYFLVILTVPFTKHFLQGLKKLALIISFIFSQITNLLKILFKI